MELLTALSSLPCQNCRTSKKRCFHVETGSVAETVQRVKVAAPAVLESHPEADTRESSLGPGRVSEYNPESVLEDLSEEPKSGTRSTSSRPEAQIAPQQQKSPSATHKAQRQLIWYQRHRQKPTPPGLSKPHREYLTEVGAFLDLPRATSNTLLPLYVSLLDDLIPIVDGAGVFRDYSNGKSSIYLVRAMCLVACKIKQAAASLRLKDNGPLLEATKFASELLTGLDAAIKADLELDRVIKVQILALMHLHNDGLAGVDRSAHYLSQAISEAWSLSLHWNIPGNSDQDQCDFLWWTLRNLDRLNKPVMGASPFIIDDTDIALQRITPKEGSYRSHIMGISITLGDLMATATKIYKASSKATADDCLDFPSLSDLTSGTTFDRFHRSHRAYLEIWYHVAAMLSCRYSEPGSIPYNRRLASADRIIDIVLHVGHEGLPPLPLVPYAMSMSTTIIYRALRDEQRDVCSACEGLRFCCDTLDTFSQQWTSAKCVAKLAKRLWRVLTKSEALHEPSPHQHKNSQEKGTSEEAISTDAEDTWAIADLHSSMGAHDRVLDSTTLPQTYHGVTEDAATGSWLESEIQLVQNLPGMDASYFQLDRAFQELFDYGMPNILRDPIAWDVGEIDLNNEFDLSSYLPSPDLE
ncbi:hypothetical protein AK830_g2474 [Neonectria ditissima]|uniref:Transcription factor domain-containing protein n=1 Tax=Neonectria ditissima TaxID=78410 RepID=A0A0P7BS33_9HYPO|nr:hypothetical protein AK830_g2474 [Neonectria ditissima]